MVLMPTRHGDVRIYVRWSSGSEGKDFSSLSELVAWRQQHRALGIEIHYWCLDHSGVIEPVRYANGVYGTDTGERVYLTMTGQLTSLTGLLEAVRERREVLERRAAEQQQAPKPLRGCNKHKLSHHRNWRKRSKLSRNKRRSAV